MRAETVYPGQVVTTVVPVCVMENDSLDEKRITRGEPELVVQYSRSISERYIKCRFLNAQGEVVYNEFEYHHFIPVQSTFGMSITD